MMDTIGELHKNVEFVHAYNMPEGEQLEARIDIRIPMEIRDECLEELMTALLNQMDPVMRYFDENESMSFLPSPLNLN